MIAEELIRYNIEKFEIELKFLERKIREQKKTIHDEYVRWIKCKYNLTEERMNSKFIFEKGDWSDIIFDKLEFREDNERYLMAYRADRQGNIMKWIFHERLKDIVWLDEINTNKEN